MSAILQVWGRGSQEKHAPSWFKDWGYSFHYDSELKRVRTAIIWLLPRIRRCGEKITERLIDLVEEAVIFFKRDTNLGCLAERIEPTLIGELSHCCGYPSMFNKWINKRNPKCNISSPTYSRNTAQSYKHKPGDHFLYAFLREKQLDFYSFMPSLKMPKNWATI